MCRTRVGACRPGKTCPIMPNVAVLCPGPSLAAYWADGGEWASRCDLIVAVNRAGWLFRCDWLALSDEHIIQPIIQGSICPPRVGYITHCEMTLPSGAVRRQPPMYRVPQGSKATPCAWTFPNALRFACENANGGEVLLFGFDCSPGPDVVQERPNLVPSGNIQAGSHGSKRWLDELPWIKEAWVAGRVRPIGSQAHPAVLAWLQKDETWDAVVKIMRGRDGSSTEKDKCVH